MTNYGIKAGMLIEIDEKIGIKGSRVRDALFYPDSGINRGTGTIIEIEEMEEPPRGAYSVIVKWDKPIPEGNPTGLTEDTSDDYLDDLILLESEE